MKGNESGLELGQTTSSANIIKIMEAIPEWPIKAKLEDYRQGYPRLAAFLCLDKNFTVFRRFDYLHIRSLLEQQDQLAELETRLNSCDDTEIIQIGLNSRRHDLNQERRHIMGLIDTRLQLYDEAVQRFDSMLRLSAATKGQRQSVFNWVAGNKPLVRSESACHLGCLDSKDYAVLGLDESEKAGMESVIDLIVKKFPAVANRLSNSRSKTDDPNVYTFPPDLLMWITKITLSILLPLWLVLPVALLAGVPDSFSRTIICCLFTLGFSFLVIAIVNTSKFDMILAFIAYATLLAAFIAGNSQIELP